MAAGTYNSYLLRKSKGTGLICNLCLRIKKKPKDMLANFCVMVDISNLSLQTFHVWNLALFKSNSRLQTLKEGL